MKNIKLPGVLPQREKKRDKKFESQTEINVTSG